MKVVELILLPLKILHSIFSGNTSEGWRSAALPLGTGFFFWGLLAGYLSGHEFSITHEAIQLAISFFGAEVFSWACIPVAMWLVDNDVVIPRVVRIMVVMVVMGMFLFSLGNWRGALRAVGLFWLYVLIRILPLCFAAQKEVGRAARETVIRKSSYRLISVIPSLAVAALVSSTDNILIGCSFIGTFMLLVGIIELKTTSGPINAAVTGLH